MVADALGDAYVLWRPRNYSGPQNEASCQWNEAVGRTPQSLRAIEQ
jgi:hypothetical protein